MDKTEKSTEAKVEEIQTEPVKPKKPEPLTNYFSADFEKEVNTYKEFDKQLEVYTRKEIPKLEPTEKPKKTKIMGLASKKTVIETPNYDLIDVKETGLKFDEKTKVKKRFRQRIFIGVFCFVFAICAGWVVYNSIEINNTNYQIVNYLIKIDQLDQINQVQSGDGSLISTVVPIEPAPLAEPTETQPQTNWFNKFCNWLTKVFRG